MSRPLRIEYPNAVYHVTSRGNAREKIVNSDQDRKNFLIIFGFVIKRYNWFCHAYCLMDNHYHLVIETPDANLSIGMRQLNGIYTQRYNSRHNRVGHLFQGRYKAIIIEKENYLLELCRYIVLNPVRANIVEDVEKWKWSSYGATAGLRIKPNWLTVEWILGLFSDKKKKAERLYREFVKDGTADRSLFDKVQGQVVLGGEDFVNKLKELLSDKEKIKEIPRVQRYITRPNLKELFNEKHGKLQRDRAICDACLRYGYTFKEIADHLIIHYTTVSKVISRSERDGGD